jgi:chemotaxis signal transduction protein
MNTPTHDTQMVVFTVGTERYALPTTIAREVLELRPMRTLPGAGACVRGVMSLRGDIVPVLHLSRVLGTHGAEDSPGSHLVVCDTVRGPVGLIADEVSSVRALPDAIDAAGASTQRGVHPAARAVSVIDDDQLVVVLDIERVVDAVNFPIIDARPNQEAAA